MCPTMKIRMAKGCCWGGEGSERISIHHNLLAHNDERNPRIKTSGVVDIVNNVIYNPGFTGGWGPSHISNEFSAVPVNYIGNYYKAGINSASADYYISTSGGVEIFVQGNITPKRTSNAMDEGEGVVRPSDLQWVVPSRHATAAIKTTTAFAAFDQVLTDAGATAGLNCIGSFYARQDAIDARIKNDLSSGTGNIIARPSDVGGWPDLAPGTACTDTDKDGMPDVWENGRGHNPNDPADGAMDANGDGYTNVEEYLNGSPIILNKVIYLPTILKLIGVKDRPF